MKVKITQEEMNKITKILMMAKLSSNPTEVKLYRQLFNSIINKANLRN
jgi:hypothetical protein